MAAPKCTPRIDFSEEYDTSSLKGKSAVVTGAGNGIGESIATGLAKAGAYVTVVEWNEENGQAVVKKLTDQGLKAQFKKADVTKWEELVSAFKAALAFSPNNTIDIVIPNAGVASNPLVPWLSNAPEDPETGDPLIPSQAVVDINFTSVYNTTLLAMYWFKKYPGTDASYAKQIIFVGSMASYQGMTGVPSYGGAKFGVRGIFKAMRDLPKDVLGEGRPSVRMNMIAPSWIRSGMTDKIVPYLEKNAVRVGNPEDCTFVVLRMCADENVQGRACSVIGEKRSFDLCDDYDGVDGTRELLEAYKRDAFGDRSQRPKEGGPKIEDLLPNDNKK